MSFLIRSGEIAYSFLSVLFTFKIVLYFKKNFAVHGDVYKERNHWSV